MNPNQLLAKFAKLGITLWAAGDKLRYRPKAAMTDELAGLLRKHKAEILAALSSEQVQLPPATQHRDRSQTSSRNPSWPTDGWPDRDVIPISEVAPCPTCNVIDHWESALGDWRCRRCEPQPEWVANFQQEADRRRQFEEFH